MVTREEVEAAFDFSRVQSKAVRATITGIVADRLANVSDLQGYRGWVVTHDRSQQLSRMSITMRPSMDWADDDEECVGTWKGA